MVCKPGFLSNVISSLSAKLHLSRETECALILDEISIRSDTQWDKKKSQFVGNIDYGEIKGEDAENIASNVLVVMAKANSILFNQQNKQPNSSTNHKESYNRFMS